jgi:hypothetical protein
VTTQRAFPSARVFYGLMGLEGDIPRNFNENIIERLLVDLLNQYPKVGCTVFPGPNPGSELTWKSGHTLDRAKTDITGWDREKLDVVLEVKVSAAWSFPTTQRKTKNQPAEYGASQLDRYCDDSPDDALHYVVMPSWRANGFPRWRQKRPEMRDPTTETSGTDRKADRFRYPGKGGVRDHKSADHWTLVTYSQVKEAMSGQVPQADLADANKDSFVEFLHHLGKSN